jgi:hypothetical protein
MMDRSTIFNIISRRLPWMTKGTWLISLFYPREWWAQRKRDQAMRKRFNDFCATRGLRKIDGKWEKSR